MQKLPLFLVLSFIRVLLQLLEVASVKHNTGEFDFDINLLEQTKVKLNNFGSSRRNTS